MRNRKEEIWQGLEYKVMVIRQANLDGNELWSGDMGMERKGRNRKTGGKI